VKKPPATLPSTMAGIDQSAVLPSTTNNAPVTTAVIEVLAANHTKAKLRGRPWRSAAGT
jgi:hypothetical protein